MGFLILSINQGDQDLNSNRLASIGAAVKFEIGEIAVDTFKRAIENAVYVPRYLNI